MWRVRICSSGFPPGRSSGRSSGDFGGRRMNPNLILPPTTTADVGPPSRIRPPAQGAGGRWAHTTLPTGAVIRARPGLRGSRIRRGAPFRGSRVKGGQRGGDVIGPWRKGTGTGRGASGSGRPDGRNDGGSAADAGGGRGNGRSNGIGRQRWWCFRVAARTADDINGGEISTRA